MRAKTIQLLRGAMVSALVGATASAYVIHDSPRWPDGTVTFELQLGANSSPLTDGSASWDEAAAGAITAWNAAMSRLQLRGVPGSTAPIGQGNGRNNVFFSDKAYDSDFGDRTLAITFSRWTTGSRERRTEADIIFNRGEQWDSYRGSLRSRNGRSLADLRRVAIHEIGHALGLDHPDQSDQSVQAIMNSRIGNLDTLANDDVTAIQTLYGVPVTGTGAPRLANLSVRSPAGSGSRTLIAGFITGGGESTLLIRGIGPSLSAYGVTTALPDPGLTLYGGSDILGSNDNWGGSTLLSNGFGQAGAFALSTTSRDAALQRTLPAGVYSAHLTEAQGRTGIGLIEVYAQESLAQGGSLLNISARTEVGTGADVLIIGFVIAGNGQARVLIRAVGPSLTQFGVENVLANPRLVVFRGDSVIAENDDWAANAPSVASVAANVSAFALTTNSRDSALVVPLAPGAYTAQVSGVGGTTGVGLVELYLVP